MKVIEEHYRAILDRVRAAAGSAEAASRITLIAVSKTQPIDSIEALYRLGHRDFGENYVQELLSKATELENRGCTGIRWHFIGHLQTNKVKPLIPSVHVLHTLDSERLARELDKRWATSGRKGRLPVIIEVNVDREPEKSGVTPEEAPRLAAFASSLSSLDLFGLMCIPSPQSSRSGEAFRRLKELELRCRPHTRGALSMGMSDDFEIAIREGATHVRVGTAIFGKRPNA